MLVDDRPLELDESEFFDDAEDMSPGSGGAPASMQLQSAVGVQAAAAAAHHHNVADSESESDDDGIVLESECSSSEGEDQVEEELAMRIQSLQSSLEQTAPLPDHSEALGTSHSSQVGSLKSFGGVSFKGKRLFGSEGDLAASVPVRCSAPMYAARRKVAPAVDKSSSHLGTSMPISIPMMQRRGSNVDLQAAELRDAPATFVPPHMLHRQETVDVQGGLIAPPGSELGLSPSRGREKLLARNAILRSTGFIEVQHPPVIGEVLDPVKEVLGALTPSPSSGAMAVPGMRADSRATPRSSLTQLLGTSK